MAPKRKKTENNSDAKRVRNTYTLDTKVQVLESLKQGNKIVQTSKKFNIVYCENGKSSE